MITYSKKGNKYVFNKGGVFFSMTIEQIDELEDLFEEIKIDLDSNNK